MKIFAWTFVVGVLWVGHPPIVFADLNEEGFESYQLGNVDDQKGWTKRFKGVVEVSKDKKNENKFLLFKKQLSSIIKQFEPTKSDNVIIEFDFIPGAETLGGRLYFLQNWKKNILALRFTHGTLHLLEKVKKGRTDSDTDSGIEFKIDQWNHFKLNLDFKKHNYEVFMNKKSIGIYQMIDKSATGVDSLNFFAGKQGSASCLDNLTIVFDSEDVKNANINKKKVKK